MKKLTCLECGGEIHISNNGLTGKCAYCGNEFLLKEPLTDGQFVNLQLATEYLLTFKFADAKRLFLSLAKEIEGFATAYFGAFLAEYGIEIVVDKLGNKIPTCHRASVVSVYNNEFYINAIKYASNTQKEEYEKLGESIEKVRLEILNQVEDGTSYDIFICFKASEIEDENKKTADLELANNLYNFLAEKGYKVFNSATTLLRVKEQNFEPYIYRALSTAKVMLLLCSSVEKIESAWVKNEWARFLDINNGQGLVPICGNRFTVYSPLALPHELQKLNAIVYDEDVKEKILQKVSAFFIEKQEKAKEKEFKPTFEETTENVEENVYVYDIWVEEVFNFDKTAEIISDLAKIELIEAEKLVKEKGVFLQSVNKMVKNHTLSALNGFATLKIEQRRVITILPSNVEKIVEEAEEKVNKAWDKNTTIVQTNVDKI